MSLAVSTFACTLPVLMSTPGCLQEFGLPSSHTLNSCVLNYYIIYFCLVRNFPYRNAACNVARLPVVEMLPAMRHSTGGSIAGLLTSIWLRSTLSPSSKQEQGLISTFTGRCLYVVASVWIAFIAFSRMYLGMHTVRVHDFLCVP